MEVVIRGSRTSDLNFIMSTWLRGQRHGCTYYSEIDSKAYYDLQGLVLLDTMANPKCSIRVACLDTEPDLILGYSVVTWSGEPLINWVYVKSAFRGQGIANKLLEGVNAKTVTSLTDLGNDIRKTKGYIFNPFAT